MRFLVMPRVHLVPNDACLGRGRKDENEASSVAGYYSRVKVPETLSVEVVV